MQFKMNCGESDHYFHFGWVIYIHIHSKVWGTDDFLDAFTFYFTKAEFLLILESL